MINLNTELKWNGDKAKIQGKKVMNKSLFETGLIIEGQAKSLAPVDNGRLAGSITTQSIDNQTYPESPAGGSDVISKPSRKEEVRVGSAVNYAPWIEFGTSPYTIKAKSAKVLTDGKSFFGKTVNHPGIPAQPYLRPALALAQGKVVNLFRENGKIYFSDFMKK